MTDPRQRTSGSGVLAGLACFSIWGLFPAFFPLLEPAGPAEIVAHRIVWTLVVMLVVLAVTRRLPQLARLGRKDWQLIVAAASLISINWVVYVHAINSARVTEAALGYFITPLVSVVLGMLVFAERVRRPQMVAVGIAAVAVAVLTVGYGHVPFLSLLLALSFGFYGVVKKRVTLPPTVSLTAEVIVTAPFALALLAWLQWRGQGHFLGHGIGHGLLMVSAGLVTAVPLLLFGIAAQRIPLALVGMLQYLTPCLQMLWAVVVVHEHLDATRWVGFATVLLAVAVFSGSGLAPRGSARGVVGRP